MCILCASSETCARREPSEVAVSAQGRVSRRSVLAGAGGLAAAAGLAAWPAGASAAAYRPAGKTGAKLEVVLLGTHAGPPIVPDRTGIATALVVDGHVYLIDCGR